jgi:hypothetical protein
VSLFSCRSVASGALFWKNDAHDPSGFDVPEHFREPEFMSLDSNDFLFCAIGLIGVHLVRFRLSIGIVRREASPPSEPLGGRSLSAEGWATLCACLIVCPVGRVGAFTCRRARAVGRDDRVGRSLTVMAHRSSARASGHG